MSLVTGLAGALLAVSALPVAANGGPWVIDSDTTLTGDYVGNIVIQSDNVTLDCAGYAVRGPGDGVTPAGVLIQGASGVTVKRCLVTGFTFGSGIHAADSDGVLIAGNTVTDNTGVGIVLEGSPQGAIKDNVLDGNYDGINVGAATGFSVLGNTITGSLSHGLHVGDSSDGSIVGNSSSYNGALGFVATGSTGLLIKDNKATDNHYWAGIALFDTTSSEISDNVALRNSQGFEIQSAEGNTFKSNVASDNDLNGFVFLGSSNGDLRQNVAKGNASTGFVLVDFSDNTLRENVAGENGESGFGLGSDSVGNYFSQNRACRNGTIDLYQQEGPNTYSENHFCTTEGI